MSSRRIDIKHTAVYATETVEQAKEKDTSGSQSVMGLVK